MSKSEPDLTNPDWCPSEAEEREIGRAFALRVAWEKAMAARSIKALALDLSPEEEAAEIEAWSQRQQLTVASSEA